MAPGRRMTPSNRRAASSAESRGGGLAGGPPTRRAPATRPATTRGASGKSVRAKTWTRRLLVAAHLPAGEVPQADPVDTPGPRLRTRLGEAHRGVMYPFLVGRSAVFAPGGVMTFACCEPACLSLQDLPAAPPRRPTPRPGARHTVVENDGDLSGSRNGGRTDAKRYGSGPSSAGPAATSSSCRAASMPPTMPVASACSTARRPIITQPKSADLSRTAAQDQQASQGPAHSRSRQGGLTTGQLDGRDPQRAVLEAHAKAEARSQGFELLHDHAFQRPVANSLAPRDEQV